MTTHDFNQRRERIIIQTVSVLPVGPYKDECKPVIQAAVDLAIALGQEYYAEAEIEPIFDDY